MRKTPQLDSIPATKAGCPISRSFFARCGIPQASPSSLSRGHGSPGKKWTILSILQNPGKNIVVDVAASRHQADAFSADELPLFQRGGQAGRTCSLHHIVRIGKVEPHGHTNFFLTHAHDAVYIAEYYFKRSIVGHTASHSVGKERGHRSRDRASCLERERICRRAFGDNTHNFRLQF